MRLFKFMAPMVLALIVCACAQAEEKEHKPLVGTLAAGDKATAFVLTTTAHKKADGTAGEAKTYKLVVAEADAGKAKELVGKKVEVTGTGTMDEYKVTAIAEAKPKEKKPK